MVWRIREEAAERLVQSRRRGIHGVLDASIGGGGVERWESSVVRFFFSVFAGSILNPDRDVRGRLKGRNSPRAWDGGRRVRSLASHIKDRPLDVFWCFISP